jgi:hypothetical protein
MRLIDFYAVDEGCSRYFTIEPRHDGSGRLLSWETGDVFVEGVGGSYEEIARGDIGHLIDEMRARLPSTEKFEGSIRRAYEEILDEGYSGWHVRIDDAGATVQTGSDGTDGD